MSLLLEHGEMLLTACAMGMACAVLSVFVVLRRWAFIGEAIAHGGFGGAGTAWLLALLFPSAAFLATTAGVYVVAVLFCIGIGMTIAFVTRRERVRVDTAIGIVLVAALAWGFMARSIYLQQREGMEPPGWQEFLLGSFPAGHGLAAAAICAAVLLTVIFLGKEILAYCFDPRLAEVSGVRVSLVHYLMILMLTMTILVGMRIMGSLLVTALLVLPGAIGMMVSRRLGVVMAASVAAGLVGALAGPLISLLWSFIPPGPAVVLALVMQFGVVYMWSLITPKGEP